MKLKTLNYRKGFQGITCDEFKYLFIHCLKKNASKSIELEKDVNGTVDQLFICVYIL